VRMRLRVSGCDAAGGGDEDVAMVIRHLNKWKLHSLNRLV
jgi:hypothetical protein